MYLKCNDVVDRLLTNDSAIYNRPDIIKKEAMGLDYTDLGEIQEVGPEYIKTKKGIIK